MSPKKKPAAHLRPLTVSVIVPAYNEEKLIGRTLLNLSGLVPKPQMIIADGYSKDKTVAIARKYGKVVFEKEHTVGGGRNSGSAIATGDIVWFVDADTFPDKEFYKQMVEAFEDPTVVGVGCQVMPEGIGFFNTLFFRLLNFMIYSTFLVGKPVVAGSCVAYRKSAFKKTGGFDTKTKSAEDFDLCLRISKFGKVKYLFHQTVVTSDRRVYELGVLGLLKDWTRTSVMFLAGRKTTTYFAPR